jgi:hypothetical protein
MVNTSQIVIEGYGAVDTDDSNIPLNFSVAEIQDLNKRQGTWSKTITLPGTPNNKNIFSHLYDVNTLDATFDYNKKVTAYVMQNGVSVLKGYLQLINVKKVAPSGIQDEQVQFEVLIKDAAADFMKSGIGERLLTDFDFSQYDHTYTLSAITATSAHTFVDAYKYHLYSNISNIYGLKKFTPSIFAKQYWDKIFEASGYNYIWTGSSFTEFCSYIVPYNGDKAIVDLSGSTFRAGMSASTTGVLTSSLFLLGPASTFFNPAFNDDSNLPNFDPAGLYNTTTGVYTTSINGTEQINIRFNYEIYLSSATVNTQTAGVLGIDLFHRAYINSDFIPLNEPRFLQSAYTGLNLLSGLNYLTSGSTKLSYTTPVDVGDLIEYRTEGQVLNVSIWSGPQPVFVVVIAPDFSDPNFNTYFNTPTAELGEGMTVKLNNFIPKNFKAKDLFASIVAMQNLYISTSKESDRTLIIESRDEFYDNGNELDWTHLIDLGSEIKLEFIPDVTNKSVVLTYKEENNTLYNKAYKDSTGEIYGQFRYTFPSEFVDSQKTIGPQFSPSPITSNFDLITTYLQDSQAPKTNPRILIDGGWIPGNWVYRQNNSSGSTIISFDHYPVATMYDNPYTPTYSIHYGLPAYEFYNTYDYLTNNNLYNRYWKRFFTQIETGKMMTARFKLNESNIANLNLRDRIFIKDSWWYINAIKDYNPNSIGTTTTVELLSVEDGLRFSKFESTKVDVTGVFTDVWNLGTIEIGGFDNTIGEDVVEGEILGDDNVIQDSTVRMRIAGNNNIGAANLSRINGNSNLIAGNNIQVSGDFNAVTGGTSSFVTIEGSSNILSDNTSNVNIFGNGNRVLYGSTNVGLFNSYNCLVNPGLTNVTIIGGNGVTATTSNTVYGVGSGTTGNFLPISGGTLTGPVVGTTFTGTFIGDGSNLSGLTDVYITGATFSAGTLNLQNNTGGTVTAVGDFPWEFVQTGQTVGATNINLCNYFVGSSNNCYNVKGYVTGINTSGSLVYGAEMYCVIKSTGTTFFQVGKIINTKTSEFASADSTISFASSASTIFLNCIGQTAETINWRANLKIY